MQLRENGPVSSATDLSRFLACRHLIALERMRLHGLVEKQRHDDPMLEVLRQRGLEHEAGYVRALEQSGKRAVRAPRSAR